MPPKSDTTYMLTTKILVLVVAGFVAVACVSAVIAAIVNAVRKRKDKHHGSK